MNGLLPAAAFVSHFSWQFRAFFHYYLFYNFIFYFIVWPAINCSIPIHVNERMRDRWKEPPIEHTFGPKIKLSKIMIHDSWMIFSHASIFMYLFEVFPEWFSRSVSVHRVSSSSHVTDIAIESQIKNWCQSIIIIIIMFDRSFFFFRTKLIFFRVLLTHEHNMKFALHSRSKA